MRDRSEFEWKITELSLRPALLLLSKSNKLKRTGKFRHTTAKIYISIDLRYYKATHWEHFITVSRSRITTFVVAVVEVQTAEHK
jgi:hypothetical protein